MGSFVRGFGWLCDLVEEFVVLLDSAGSAMGGTVAGGHRRRFPAGDLHQVIVGTASCHPLIGKPSAKFVGAHDLIKSSTFAHPCEQLRN